MRGAVGTRPTGARAPRGGGPPTHVAAFGCRAASASAAASAAGAAGAAVASAALSSPAAAVAAAAAAAAAPGRRSRPLYRWGPGGGVVAAASAVAGGSGGNGGGGGGSGGGSRQQQQQQQQYQPGAASQGGGHDDHNSPQRPAPLPLLAREMPLLRRLATAPSAHAAADLLHDWIWQRQQQEQQQQRQEQQEQQQRQEDEGQGQQQQQQQQARPAPAPPASSPWPRPPASVLPLTGEDAELLLAAALERGNAALALGVYDEMALVAGGGLGAAGAAGFPSFAPPYPGGGGGGGIGGGGASSRDGRTFPPLTLRLTTALVLGLCRAMRLPEAMRVLARVRSRGGPVASPSPSAGGAGAAASLLSTDDGGGGGGGGDGPAAAAYAAASAAAPLSVASFGLVVRSPLPPHGPLTVVPPHEGAQAAADSASRYEFELFTGQVAAIESEALPAGGGGLGALLGAALRSAGLSPGGRAPPAAVHDLVVRSPDGSARAFRVAAASADVPARPGERVTLACAPARGAPSRAPRRRLLLTASPPGSRPGEPLEVTNHATGLVLPLLRAPTKGAAAAGGAGGAPGWALPLAVLLAGSDAASALLDPGLPALLAAGAAAASLSALLGSRLAIPALKRLPAASVEVEYARQRLLAQHQALAVKAGGALREARGDARALARLWQLQAKMEAVGGDVAAAAMAASPSSSFSAAGASLGAGGPTWGSGAVTAASAGAVAVVVSPAAAAALAPSSPVAYGARIGRVAQARAEIEARLARRIELLDGYARVMAMIEIEIELDLRDTAELLQLQFGPAGLGGGGGGADGGGGGGAMAAWGGGVGAAELARLAELEALREEWAGQAEARDEVERLLG